MNSLSVLQCAHVNMLRYAIVGSNGFLSSSVCEFINSSANDTALESASDTTPTRIPMKTTDDIGTSRGAETEVFLRDARTFGLTGKQAPFLLPQRSSTSSRAPPMFSLAFLMLLTCYSRKKQMFSHSRIFARKE